MTRTTLVSATAHAHESAGQDAEPRGSLKVFFSYAPCTGTTTAMLDEARGFSASGRDVLFVDEGTSVAGEAQRAFDLDRVLKRRPDLVVLEDLARPNAPGARNRTRYRDAEELLKAGIDVYATLRVSDLENERSRMLQLGVEVPPESVPDYLLYGARRLEFVDIDPTELVERAKLQRREVPQDVLRELRVLALRCVSDYAAANDSSEVPEGLATGVSAFGNVLAVVASGEEPRPVVLEAARLALLTHGEVTVVGVRRGRRAAGPYAATEEEAAAALADQVAALGYELVSLSGDDAAEAVCSYARSHGVPDVVLTRRHITFSRRAAALLVPPFEERLAAGLANVNIHQVAGDQVRASLGVLRRSATPLRDFAPRDLLFAAAAVAVSFLLARFLVNLGAAEAVSYVMLLFGVAGAAFLTYSYVPTLLAALAAVLLQDYYFVRPYHDFLIDHSASLLTVCVFAFASVALAGLAVHTCRARRRADAREQRTQALYDLDRRLSVASGKHAVVDDALDVVVRLFNRSAALYLSDLLVDPVADAGSLVVRVVPGDLEKPRFSRPNEQAVAHWVYMNGVPAGAGTDTHAASDVLFLPLENRAGVVAVIALSCRRGLSPSERGMFDLMAKQVALALERQDLMASHRLDALSLRVSEVRSTFVNCSVHALGVAAETTAGLVDLASTVKDEERPYRDALYAAVAEETARSRQVGERLADVLGRTDAPLVDLCDVVGEAVCEVRAGLAGKSVAFDEEDHPAPVVADASLLHLAVKCLLDAATTYADANGVVEVSVRSYADRVLIEVADARPTSGVPGRTAAFELGARPAAAGVPSYAETRARLLREALLDRASILADNQGFLGALCRAMQLSPKAVRADSDPDGVLNRRRILRYDRLEYGLYLAALVAYAHGGSVRQRIRLGGGVITTLQLPRD